MSAFGLLVTAFLVLVFICFVTLHAYLYHWLVLAVLVGSLLLTYAMFADDSQWIFDPFYGNWKRKVERERVLS